MIHMMVMGDEQSDGVVVMMKMMVMVRVVVMAIVTGTMAVVTGDNDYWL